MLTAQGTALLASRGCLYVSGGRGGSVPTCPQGKELNALSGSLCFRTTLPLQLGSFIQGFELKGVPVRRRGWWIQSWEMTSVFPQLYELDADPKRKEFLDDLFSFMQKRGEWVDVREGPSRTRFKEGKPQGLVLSLGPLCRDLSLEAPILWVLNSVFNL